ncbi:hypothetical protein FM112_08600 [Gulosibacter sp. 10]|nr:hypothetical protein FM112_08600 [Gulosibacter sp. 10]
MRRGRFRIRPRFSTLVDLHYLQPCRPMSDSRAQGGDEFHVARP